MTNPVPPKSPRKRQAPAFRKTALPKGPEPEPKHRDGKGRYLPTVSAEERRRLSWEARSIHFRTWQEIADLYWNGSVGTAHDQVSAHMATMGVRNGLETRELLVTQLETLQRELRQIQQERFVKIDNGRVIQDDEGNPILDREPVMRAIEMTAKMGERIAKLVPGALAPSRTQEVTEDQLDHEREQLLKALAAIQVNEEDEDE